MTIAERAYLSLAISLLPLLGCGDDELASGEPSRNVTQGGPQDVAEFREILSAGQVPAAETLDEVGFFAEHALDLPAADCGAPLCSHAMLAVAPRFDGGNWTMAFIALNTALDAAALAQGPRHLLVVVENTPATRATLPDFFVIASALGRSLEPDDRVTVIEAGSSARVLGVALPPSELERLSLRPIEVTIAVTDAYGALSRAYEIATGPELEGFAQQLLFFSSGHASGVTSLSRFEALAEQFVAAGVPITSFGMGTDYRRELPRTLAEVGSGNYYFAEDGVDLHEAMLVEAETGFTTLAEQFELTLRAAPGYRIGRIYGARRSEVTEGEATLRSPALFIGARRGAADPVLERRGGGGGFFVELLADVEPGEGEPAEAPVCGLSTAFVDPRSDEPIALEHSLSTPLGAGQNPDPAQPFFSDPTRAKPFMMLNMYLALRTALELYEAGDCGAALGVEEMMLQSYLYWSRVYDDNDIDADFELLEDLSTAIDRGCQEPIVQPVHVPYSCFIF